MTSFELSPAIPQLPSGDIDVTASFFTRLGFETVSLMKDHGFRMIRRGPVELHFWQAESVDVARTIAGASSCYIRVKNISAFFSELDTNGVEFRYRLKVQPWGMNEFQVDDPFGNAIKFGESVS